MCNLCDVIPNERTCPVREGSTIKAGREDCRTEAYSTGWSRVSYLLFYGRRCGGCTGRSRRELSVFTSRHVEICVVQKETFAKTIQSVAIGRDSQSIGLIRAEESRELDRRSIDAPGDQRVGFGFPAAGMPRTL